MLVITYQDRTYVVRTEVELLLLLALLIGTAMPFARLAVTAGGEAV